ncbi:MAG: FkbM family methyltransferase [Thermomicrobiales bacterium]
MNKGPVVRLGRRLGRVVARRIPTGTPIPIVSGPLRGSRWLAGANAGAGKGLSIVVNRYEHAQLAAAWTLLEPGSVCLDVGANTGLYSLLFSKKARLVYAFEPMPENVARFCAIMRWNRVKNVIVVPCAVGAESALVGLTEGITHACSAIAEHGRQPAACLSCDDFCERFSVTPGMIKIDVEGAELDVLRGAQTTLATSKPTILLSVHSEELRRQCLSYLLSLGYGSCAALANPEDTSGFEREFVVTTDHDHLGRSGLRWSSTEAMAEPAPTVAHQAVPSFECGTQ